MADEEELFEMIQYYDPDMGDDVVVPVTVSKDEIKKYTSEEL